MPNRTRSARSRLDTLRRFIRSRRGNVTITFAFAALPLLFAMGMGIDYVSATRRRDKLNGVADAAALSAVTPGMLSQSTTYAKTVATTMFTGQAAALGGVTLNASSPVVNVVDTATANGTVRTVTVAYSANSANFFPGLLQRSNIVIGGTAASKAATQPNTNFYLMLDTSPSMAIAATTAGITVMVNNTPSQGGCAFACHETNPGGDNLGNPGGEDNYALARNLNVTLRIDLVQQAVQNLMTTAQQTENTTKAVYGMSIYDFDYTTHKISDMTTNLASAQNSASNIQMLSVYKNGYLTSNNSNNDMDTNWDGSMSAMNSAMNTPGNGTNNSGDSPQEVLFIVTDGVVDENLSSNRTMNAMGGTWCNTVKNRNIRIAILYTTYNPLPTNSFYNSYIAPFQPNIPLSLQQCASPNLFFQVNTGDDISSAMSTLFQQTVGVAHLTQ